MTDVSACCGTSFDFIAYFGYFHTILTFKNAQKKTIKSIKGRYITCSNIGYIKISICMCDDMEYHSQRQISDKCIHLKMW